MSKENGGPAFPQPIANAGKGAGLVSADEMFVGGMTLRDYFAAKAPECPSNYLTTQRGIDHGRNPYNEAHRPPLRSDLQIIAEWNFAYADAMLAERSKP